MTCSECPVSLLCLSGALEQQQRAYRCTNCGALIVYKHPRDSNYNLGLITLWCEPCADESVRFPDATYSHCPRCYPEGYQFSLHYQYREMEHYVTATLCLSHKQWQYRRRGKKGVANGHRSGQRNRPAHGR